MVTEQTTAQKSTTAKPETPKTRGRKPGKSSNQKKQPRRGPGVAQLERLILEERRKKMTEIPQQQQQKPLNLVGQCNFQEVQTNLPVSDPLRSVPVVHFGASNYGGASS